MFEQLASSTSLCTGCPKMCRHACPVANAELRETVTPGTKMAALDLVRLGALPLDQHAAELMHACTGCGACAEYCLLGVEPGTVLIQARSNAAAAGVSPVAARVQEAFWKAGNITGLDLAPFYKEHCPPRPERASLTYIPSPTALVHLPEHTRDQVELLELLTGATVAIAPFNEAAASVGVELFEAGLTQDFITHARRVVAHLSGRGTLVSSDANVVWALRDLYPSMGIQTDWKVLHSSEIAAAAPVPKAPHVEAGLYHDPCVLGRRLGIYDSPRALLEAATGSAPQEFTWCRDKAECCGAGALYPMANPAGAERAAQRRVDHEVDELARTGATRVVTACSTCELHMSRAGLRVFDLARAILGRTTPGPHR